MKLDLKKMKKLSEFERVESAPPSVLKTAASSERITAIIQVKEPNYVPERVRVRARIDPLLFTADLPTDLLGELEADHRVQSVALSRPQKLIG